MTASKTRTPKRPPKARKSRRPKRKYVIVDLTPCDTEEGIAIVEAWLKEPVDP
jgi:hypothetical protein